MKINKLVWKDLNADELWNKLVDKTRQDKTRQDKTRANCDLLYRKDLVSSKMNCGKTQFHFSDFFCCVRVRDGWMMSEKIDGD